MAFEKGNKLGKKFTSDNQPQNRGRKPSLYKKLRTITGKTVKHEMSKEDYYDILKYLMEQTPAQLRQMAGMIKNDGEKGSMFDAEIPVWLMNMITAILGDIRYGRTTTLDSIMDRMFGKASQTVEAVIGNVDARTSNLTDEEIQDEIKRIEAALKG